MFQVHFVIKTTNKIRKPSWNIRRSSRRKKKIMKSFRRNLLINFVLAAIVCANANNLTVFDSGNSEEIVENILKILDDSIHYLNIEFDKDDSDKIEFLDALLKENKSSFVKTIYNHRDLTEEYYKFKSRENFLIISTNESLVQKLDYFVQRKGRYVFYILDNDNSDIVENLLRLIWKQKGTIDVYLVMNKVEAYTFDPFIYDFSKKVYGKVVKFNERRSFNEIFLNLNGYPIKIEHFRSVYSIPSEKNSNDFRGPDIKVRELLTEKMNFTYIPVEPSIQLFGDKLPNGSFTGAIGQLIRREIDMAATGYFIKDYQTREVEFTVAVYSDQLCCYVPKAKKVPPSIVPLFSLSFAMWLVFLFTGFACSLIWCIFRMINLCLTRRRHLNWNKIQFVVIFVDTWIVWVRIGLRNLPIFRSEKLFIISVGMVSVIFGAVFESSLATAYIKPLYYNDINNLKELDESGLEIHYKYKSMLVDLFPNDSSDLNERLHNKLKYVPGGDISTTDIMATKGGFASVTRVSVTKMEKVKLFSSNDLHLITECPKTYTISYLLRKDSALAKRINELLSNFFASGLINKWIEEVYYEYMLAESRNIVLKTSVNFKVLTLIDLQLPFYALVLGSLLAGITWLVEISWHSDVIFN